MQLYFRQPIAILLLCWPVWELSSYFLGRSAGAVQINARSEDRVRVRS
jgi:hypothetical protein